MISTIKKFFDQNLSNEPGSASGTPEHRLQLATAAMLIEVMSADDKWEFAEKEAVMTLLRNRFSLSESETRALVELAKTETDAAVDHYQFTSLINRSFSREEKMSLIEHLWVVAFADGHVDKYEDHAIRKLAELLYVDHKEFVIAKHRAQSAANVR